MDDLISRTAAIEALGECPYNWNDWPEEIQSVCDWESHKNALENLPAVDAVKVVRCKDCRFAKIENYYGFDEIICLHPIRPSCPLPVDWFCADGERREETRRDD